MNHEPHALGIAIRTCVHEAGLPILWATDFVFQHAEATGYVWTGEPTPASVLSTLGLTNGDGPGAGSPASSIPAAAPPENGSQRRGSDPSIDERKP